MLAKYKERRRGAAERIVETLDGVEPGGNIVFRFLTYGFIALLAVLKNTLVSLIGGFAVMAIILAAAAGMLVVVPLYVVYTIIDVIFMSSWFVWKATTKKGE